MKHTVLKHMLFGAISLSLGGMASAQNEEAIDPATGLTKSQFETHFGRAIRANSDRNTDAISDPALLFDHIAETRFFLTREDGILRGEIEVSANTDVAEVTLDMEDGPVVFQDTGKGADREAGDGIFSALIKKDLSKDLAQRQKALSATIDALDSGRAEGTIMLGSRAMASGEAATAEIRNFMRTNRVDNLDQARRMAEVIGQGTPLEFARRIDLDIEKTPILTFPGLTAGDLLLPDIVAGFPILPIFPHFITVPVDADASLMVTDLGTVEDPGRTFDACTGAGTPGGAWSFGHLMREMAQGSTLSAEDYTLQWLANWSIPQTVNGWTFSEPGRATNLQTRIIDHWDSLDGATDGNFDIDLFPARLLAIVNRPDLADKIGYSTAGSAGEGRFVFGLIGPGCSVQQFTVIFEYGIKGGSCQAVKSWHQRWKDLDQHAVGSAAYNAALEAITRDFTDFGGQTAGESALNQLRTNEIALGSPWQLLEFRINASGNLAMDTVKQTPDISLDRSNTLQAYLQSFEGDILAGTHIVRERFPTVVDPFLAVNSNTPFNFIFETTNPAALANHDETRHLFSLNTCSGCHAGETRTTFTHVDPRGMGTTAGLSDFLTGANMPKTITPFNAPAISKTFNDLAAREAKMGAILGRSCLSLIPFPQLMAPH